MADTASLPEVEATRQESPAAEDEATRRHFSAGDVVAVAVVAAAVGLYVWRGFGRVLTPTFWAEDGEIFFAGAYKGILASIVKPYNGYLHVIPRLVAALWNPFPVTLQPRLYVLTAIVLGLAMFSPVLSKRIAWLLPTRLARAVAFLALCLLPAVWEVYGVVAATIFQAGVAELLLALSDDPTTRTGRVAELVAVPLLGLSGPLGVLLTPLFGYRWWRVGRTRHSLYVLCLMVATSAVQLSVYLNSARKTPNTGTVAIFGEGLLKRVVGSLLVSDTNVAQSYSPDHLAIWGAIWIALAVVGVGVALRSRALPLLYAILVTFGSASYAYGDEVLRSVLLQRHLLVPHAAIAIGLVATIFKAPAPEPRARRIHVLTAGAALVCVAMILPGIVKQVRIDPFGPELNLTALQHCLDSKKYVCVQHTIPSRWEIIIIRKPAPAGGHVNLSGVPTAGPAAGGHVNR